MPMPWVRPGLRCRCDDHGHIRYHFFHCYLRVLLLLLWFPSVWRISKLAQKTTGATWKREKAEGTRPAGERGSKEARERTQRTGQEREGGHPSSTQTCQTWGEAAGASTQHHRVGQYSCCTASISRCRPLGPVWVVC